MMQGNILVWAATCVCVVGCGAGGTAGDKGGQTGAGQQAAAKRHFSPPMGWNSYTGYLKSITEKELRRNIDAISTRLLPHGYDTVVVDNGWFLTADTDQAAEMVLDEFGRPDGSKHFFPNGLKATIDYAHTKGLKFGIWLMRGINRRAVKENLPVKGTRYRMKDIVNMTSYCPWAVKPWYNYGVDMSKPGAQAFYDGLIQKYADMGVDFIKYDDIVPNPDEVDAVVKAIAKCGRKIVLSLSPGDHIKIEHSGAYKKANMVRITGDVWDHRGSIEGAFRRWQAMQDYDGADVNSWIDLDMVPFGRLTVTVKGGRDCRFTKDQKRTFMVQRALAASPLILGGVIYSMDEFSMSLFTHPEILACNQNGVVGKLAHRKGKIDVWRTPRRGAGDSGWIGVFNRDGKNKASVQLGWKDLALGEGGCVLKDIWTGKTLPGGKKLSLDIPPDGVAFITYRKSGP